MRQRKAMVLGMDGMQLPLVNRFCQEGVLPNFSRLIEKGSCGQLLPSIPAYTPTNWAAISTGASPGTTGLGGWYVRRYGDPWEKGLSAFDSRALSADTIMEAADRHGLKVLTVFYPNTWPPKIKKGYSVTPFYSGRGVMPFAISGPMLYRSVQGPMGPDDRGRVQFEEPSGWANLPEGRTLSCEIVVEPRSPSLVAEYDADETLPQDMERRRPLSHITLQLLIHEGSPWILWVCARKDGRSCIAKAKEGDWSPWAVLDFGATKGSVRFKPLKIDPSSGETAVIRSQVYPTTGFAHPDNLATDLHRNVGPFIERPSVGPEADADSCFEDFLYQGKWMAKTASYVRRTRGWDLYIHHFHILDSISHGYLAQSDPSWPYYDPESGEARMRILRRSYEVVDEVVGDFVKLKDEHTYLVVISDHGNAPNHWICNTVNRLREVGLMAFQGDGEGGQGIDWSRSKVYMIPQRQLEIFVNLKGRDFAGSVDPADYGKVQEKIIDALYDWREPTTGKRPVALALRKRDARILGYWGNEECGDVVFVYNGGFGRGNPGEGRSVGPALGGGANHGPQMPTTETGFSSNLASIVIAGPGIRSGYVRDEARLGPWRLIDFAPTLSYLLGIDPPLHSEGAIMKDILQD